LVIEREGKLYGRGTCDMKGFVAMCLAMVPAFQETPLTTPIHLALSYDEEVGCTGVRPMVARLGQDLPMPLAVLVGEPTMMQVVDAHKGISDFETVITGFESHSSMDLAGGNAIFAATRFIGELMRLREAYIARGDASGRFDPAYTSIHVGCIHGGTAGNIVPRHCSLNWEARSLPGDSASEIEEAMAQFAQAQILPQLRSVSADTSVVTTRLVDAPGLAPDPGSVAEVLAKRLSGSNATQTVSYATEAGLFQLAGAPTVVCGPGDIGQAHRPDEFLALSQVDACMAFLHRLTRACRTGL
jgi:acetylornithine deacetylase